MQIKLASKKFAYSKNYTYLCIVINKDTNMTKAELDFYTRMPSLLNQLVREVEHLNKKVEELTNEVKELKNNK